MCGITGRLIMLLLTYIAILSLIYGSTLGSDWGKVSDEEWEQGPPAKYPEANAVVLFDLGKMEVKQDVIKTTRHVRIKILNKAGIEEVGDISFTYDEDDNIRRLKAQTITPDGKKHKVDKKGFHTQEFGSQRARSFSFPMLDCGCIIEYTYQNTNTRYGNLDPWYFQSDMYTCRSDFNLVLDPGFTYSTATLNMPSHATSAREVTITNIDNNAPLKSYTWTMTDMPPIKPEPYMSFINNYRASLHNQLVSYQTPYNTVTFIKNWADLGELFQESLDYYLDAEKDIEKIADSLTSAITANSDRAEILYDYVNSEYITEWDDEGRYFTNEEVSGLLTTRIGTREEKNLLLMQLLRKSGIDAWPVLIGTRNNTVFLPQLYQLHQFNHVIVLAQIDTGLVFLDTWLKYCPFAVLPPESRTNGGLKLDGRNSQLIRVISRDPSTRRIDQTRIHIDPDGNAACSTVVICSGYFCAEYGHLIETEKHEDIIEEYFMENTDLVYAIDTFQIYHDSLNRLNFEFSYTIEDFCRKLDTHIIVNPIRFDFRENPFTNKKRFFPVDFNYPMMYQNMCEIYTCDSIASLTLPDPLMLAIDGARFSRNCMFDGQKVISNSMLMIENPVFTQLKYSDLREFFENVALSAEDELVLTGGSH